MVLKMIPSLFRLWKIMRLAGKGTEPPLGFDALHSVNDGCNQGVPIGGLGSGSIGRTLRGDFARWHLRIGRHEYCPSLPNQFHIRIERDGERYVQTLNPRQRSKGRLSAWQWAMDTTRAKYSALFPRAWTEYDFSDKGLRMVCRQMSPVWGHNYVESSYPVGVFVWTLTNVGSTELSASIMLTWENAISPTREPMDGDSVKVHTKTEERVILELGHDRTGVDGPVTFGLAVQGGEGIVLSACSRFDTDGTGEDIWEDFRLRGDLDDRPPFTASGRSGAALCARLTLRPRESREVVFIVSWDIPLMRFGSGRQWYRRYTRFFDASGENAGRIAECALENWRQWEERIVEWQRPVLSSDSPDWLKSALFNEMYYLVDGGTAWETGNDETGIAREGFGHFGYLECFDYAFYNTYDVHFYTWALVMNFPEIDNSIQRDFADAVMTEDNTMRMMIFERGKAPRKPLGVIPHDLGAPSEDPWYKTNAYRAQDVGRWKDLNTKFVLQVLRNFRLSRDRAFLEYCWPAVKKAMEYIDSFDTDGDGLVENEGFPDQTYDVWTMTGPSAYCAGLYLAACSAMVAMAKEMGEYEVAAKYADVLSRGKTAYVQRLWNGRYFNLDAGTGGHSDSVMADQLAGQWYALATGLEPIVDIEKTRISLETIFSLNVMGFRNGLMGAMNGMRPDGSIDKSCMQSAEVWTGTTYALAALMVHVGMLEQALKTAEGVSLVTYRDRGYWFRTPEAWTEDGDFRATMYMRPLAVWALEHALRQVQAGTE
ncbi:MAG: glucosylceramidase [Candidatus Thorarchaeota archaeon]|nr:glucosylceramidase [Candidatus Thorarchaeota archaeon]